MPEDQTKAEAEAARQPTGLEQFPKTKADLAALEAEADAMRRTPVCISLTVDGAGAAETYGFNGRETAAWVLGQWQRHYRAAADAGYDFTSADAEMFEMLARINTDHLPAVAAIMLRSGVSATIWNSEGGGSLTLRLRFGR